MTTGAIAQTQLGSLPVTDTQPLVTVDLKFFQKLSQPSVHLNIPPTISSTTGIIRTTGAIPPVKTPVSTVGASSKLTSGSSMQLVRSSGSGTPPKTTTTLKTPTTTTTSQDGRSLGWAAFVIALISTVAIFPTLSIMSSPPQTTHTSTINGNAAIIFIGAIIAYIMGHFANVRGSRAGIGASKAGGWSVALSIIITIIEIICLTYLYNHAGTYHMVPS